MPGTMNSINNTTKSLSGLPDYDLILSSASGRNIVLNPAVTSDITLFSGNFTLDSSGGNTGSSSVTGGFGYEFTCGDTTGSGFAAGSFSVFAGAGSGTSAAGDIDLTGAAGGANARGTNITLRSGNGGATSGAAGTITLTGGTAQAGNTNGGIIQLNSGSQSGSGVTYVGLNYYQTVNGFMQSTYPGAMTIGPTNQTTGRNCNVNGGTATSGNTNGGNVVLGGGYPSGTGVRGTVDIGSNLNILANILVPTGTNKASGTTGALTAGSITVSCNTVTANSLFFFSTNTLGTITLPGSYYVSARTPGTSFTITSASAVDTSTVNYFFIN